MGKGEEFVEKAELLEELKRGRVDGIATEVAEEVGVLFKNRYGDACTREEQTEHDARGTAADDAAGRTHRRDCSKWDV